MKKNMLISLLMINGLGITTTQAMDPKEPSVMVKQTVLKALIPSEDRSPVMIGNPLLVDALLDAIAFVNDDRNPNLRNAAVDLLVSYVYSIIFNTEDRNKELQEGVDKAEKTFAIYLDNYDRDMKRR